MDITLAEALLNQLYQSVNLMHRTRAEGGREHGRHSDRGQGRLLALLLRQDGLSHKDIVQEMDIRPSSAGELVSKLEQAGYVQRSYNESDKRISNVYLTAEGREVAAHNSADHAARLEQLFSGLTEQEMQQLSALMGKLIDSLRERVPDSRHDHHGHHDHHDHHDNRDNREDKRNRHSNRRREE